MCHFITFILSVQNKYTTTLSRGTGDNTLKSNLVGSLTFGLGSNEMSKSIRASPCYLDTCNGKGPPTGLGITLGFSPVLLSCEVSLFANSVGL